MARTIYYTATTLDGFLADEEDSLAWLFKQPIDDDGPHNYNDFIKDVGALVMGATTYQWLLDHSRSTGEAWGYTMPTWVMTHRTFEVPEGADVRFAADDVVRVHAELTQAAAGKDVWVVGGGDLAGQFAEAGLLDEMVVAIAPVTLGAGRPLLPRRFDLDLLETDRNRAFITARYRVVGPLR